MADLRTRYLGLELANPVVPSASTLSSRIDTLKRLQDAGAAAVVMQSLFEEQIEHEEIEIDRMLEAGAHSFPESITYVPELEDYNIGPDAYLRHLEQTKEELEDWLLAQNPDFIKRMRKARKDDLEGKGKDLETIKKELRLK